MNMNTILTFFLHHWYFITLPVGVLILLLSILRPNRTSADTPPDPWEKENRRFHRGTCFMLGCILIVMSIGAFVLSYAKFMLFLGFKAIL